MEIERLEYLELLDAWKEEKVIKVVTGIRRCGKSTLLKQYQRRLIQSGIRSDQIIEVNLEDLDNEYLLDYRELHRYLKSQLNEGRYTYIFLDEIQRVAEFEKVINSLCLHDKLDIYITGSNAYLLSSELSTLLSGRYVEIGMLPLSFREIMQLYPGETPDRVFEKYMKTGGFPYLTQMQNSDDKSALYLEGIYNTIILKDIEERTALRSHPADNRKITDLNMLKNITRFMAGSVGSLISMKSISDFITSSGRRVSQSTISDYVMALTEAFIFYPVDRFDISGRQLLRTNKKYYIADLGIRNLIVPKKKYDLGFSIENIVFLDLLRRGYQVNVGKSDDTEIDFVIQKSGNIEYIQVTASILDENTFERVIRPLRGLRDNYRKSILTLDRVSPGNYDGIEVINLIDWLMS